METLARGLAWIFYAVYYPVLVFKKAHLDFRTRIEHEAFYKQRVIKLPLIYFHHCGLCGGKSTYTHRQLKPGSDNKEHYINCFHCGSARYIHGGNDGVQEYNPEKHDE